MAKLFVTSSGTLVCGTCGTHNDPRSSSCRRCSNTWTQREVSLAPVATEESTQNTVQAPISYTKDPVSVTSATSRSQVQADHSAIKMLKIDTTKLDAWRSQYSDKVAEHRRQAPGDVPKATLQSGMRRVAHLVAGVLLLIVGFYFLSELSARIAVGTNSNLRYVVIAICTLLLPLIMKDVREFFAEGLRKEDPGVDIVRGAARVKDPELLRAAACVIAEQLVLPYKSQRKARLIPVRAFWDRIHGQVPEELKTMLGDLLIVEAWIDIYLNEWVLAPGAGPGAKQPNITKYFDLIETVASDAGRLEEAARIIRRFVPGTVYGEEYPPIEALQGRIHKTAPRAAMALEVTEFANVTSARDA